MVRQRRPVRPLCARRSTRLFEFHIVINVYAHKHHLPVHAYAPPARWSRDCNIRTHVIHHVHILTYCARMAATVLLFSSYDTYSMCTMYVFACVHCTPNSTRPFE